MKKESSIQPTKTNGLPRIIRWVLIAGLLGLGFLVHQQVSGQSPDQPWTTPINLSQSGSSTSPIVVIDSNNYIFVTWNDKFRGPTYSWYNGEKWSQPQSVPFPWNENIPSLFSDPKGYIYAFWKDPDKKLNYSRVSSTSFGNPNAWETSQVLAESAVDYSVATDSRGDVWVAYIRALDTSDTPAGIYIRQSINYGADFYSPKPLYLSPYFRSIREENSNIQVASSGSGNSAHVFVVWDNQLRKQVFLTKSINGGATWEEPKVVDSATSENSTPFRIRVGANGDNTILIWQNGDPTGICKQYYQSSTDGGINWSQTGQMLEGFSACAQDNQLFDTYNMMYLMVSTQNQVYLLAWNGKIWSEPQMQAELSGFEDPETHTQVVLGNRQADLGKVLQLVVVGNDTGSNQEIWLTSRSLENVDSWFSPLGLWKPLTNISSNSPNSLHPELVVSSDNHFHLVWSDTDPSSGVKSIFYSGLTGENWTLPSSIVDSPDGNPGQISVTTDPKGRLLLVWTDKNSGKAYFSWANAAKASSPAEWVSPLNIPSPDLGVFMPKIYSDEKGIVRIIYAIPINDHRGIYIVESKDEGRTWSKPAEVFNGASAGWDMVGQPDLTYTANGSLQAIWTRYSPPGGNGSLGLYGAKSDDQGVTWSVPEEIAAGNIDWGRIISVPNGTIHRLWLEQESDRFLIWHQYSVDDGKTWSNPISISSNGIPLPFVDVNADRSGQLHLLQAYQELTGEQLIRYWKWDGNSWELGENINLASVNNNPITNFTSAISPNGNLTSVISIGTTSNMDASTQNSLVFTNLSVNLPGSLPPAPTIIPIPTVTPVTTETPTVAPTPTPSEKTVLDVAPPPAKQNNTNNYLLLGIILTVVIVVVYIGFRIRAKFGTS